jgi:ATP-dependent DNA helicase RecG
VHRDLDHWPEGTAVEVRLTPDRLVVTNPGGLYGITAYRLGRAGTTSARNARLVELCRYARTDDGARVVETPATGIPRVLASLAAAGLPPATFSDTGLRFTAVLRPATATTAPESSLTRSQQKVYDALTGAASDVDDLEEATGLKPPNVRKVLRALIDSGLVARDGGPGRRTTYHRRGR